MNEAEARAALRARQGAGARYDATAAPADVLDLARRGTAYFARLVNNLDDDDLHGPSHVTGRNRRWLIASIGLQARMLAESVAWARTNGGRDILPFMLEADKEDIDFAATLPSQALRNLLAHSEVHLNVEWRDLTNESWQLNVCDARGVTMAMTQTPLTRATALWQTALDLNAGGRRADVPAALEVFAADR
jgi:maleylpyruvate isomerase